MDKPKLVDIETAGFELDDSLTNWLIREYPTIDAAKTYELFYDKALARGWVYANWKAAFRNYMRRSNEFGGVVFAQDPAFAPLIKLAKDIQFRMPHDHESVGVYRTALKEFDKTSVKKQASMFGNVVRRFPQ